jgi:cytochrome c2
MLKLSFALAVLGLAMLALSALPGRAPAAATAVEAPATAVATTVEAPATAVATIADAEYGRALFSAKGCVTCHRHGAIPGSGQLGGSDVPDLTNYAVNAEFLRTWLKDPRAIRPNTWMPNLELKQDEIEALIAFLSVKQ